MNEAGSIKIKITSDSDPVLRDLQKVEQKAKATFDKAASSVKNVEAQIGVLETRLDGIKMEKKRELDIGLSWDKDALDAAIQRSLDLDAAYKRVTAAVDRLSLKLEQLKIKEQEASAAHEAAAQRLLEHESVTQGVRDAEQGVSDSTDKTNDSLSRLQKLPIVQWMGRLTEKVRSLFQAFARIPAVQRVANIASRIRDTFASLARRVGTLTERIASLRKNTSKATKETNKHTRAMRQNAGGAGALGRSVDGIARALKSMLLYKAVSVVISSVKDGFADLAQYSGDTKEALSRLSTAFLYIRNAVTAVCSPVLEALAPVIETVADHFARAANGAAQFATALFGNSATYTQATKAVKEYGAETAAAAKKTNKAFASFDQINQLSIAEPETGQGAPAPEDMFAQAPVEEEIQGLADRLKAFFADLQISAAQIWDVFQQSWSQSGQATIDAAKGALSAILTLLGAIGSSFTAVWTNGTGLTLLNNLQLLLQTILGIVGLLASAFAAAWAQNDAGAMLLQNIANLLSTIIQIAVSIGQAFAAAWEQNDLGQVVLSAIIAALSGVFSLADSIGRAFVTAWNNARLGESIFSNLFSIIEGIASTVGNFAGRLQAAWESNDNGIRIWQAVLGVVDSILGTIDRIVDATAQWAAGLNLGPLISAIAGLLESIKNFVDAIGQTLSDFYSGTILPMLSWVIESGLPLIINLMGSLLNFIAEHQRLIGTLTAVVVAFIAAWKLIGVIRSVVALTSCVTELFALFAANPMLAVIGLAITLLAALIANWDKVKEVVTKVIDAIVNAIQSAIEAVKSFFSSISEGISSIASSIFGGGGSGKTGSLTMSAGTRNTAQPALASYTVSNIPKLATGAVIPPNNEFLAILGDQRHGTNIETPLATMVDAFNAALDARGGSGGATEVTVRIVADGKLVRALKTELDNESRRRGVKLVTGGAY